jgi:hypothetical protein
MRFVLSVKGCDSASDLLCGVIDIFNDKRQMTICVKVNVKVMNGGLGIGRNEIKGGLENRYLYEKEKGTHALLE